MKTVVIFIPWFDPAFKAGGPVQSITNLVNNYQDNIKYKIFTGVHDVDGTLIDVTETNKWVKYNDYTEVWYSNKKNPFPEFKKEIKIIKPDVVFITGIFSLDFNILPLLFLKSYHLILSVRGMLHPGALSQKKIKKLIFLNFLKLFKIQNKIRFHATDENEGKYIKDIFGNKSTIFIADNFPKKINRTVTIHKEENKLILITVALISPMKNYDLIIRALQQSNAQIEYHIIGGIKDEAYWNQCLDLAHQLPKNIKVIYHGEQQPQHIISFLQKAHVFIMPSKSENYGHAIIEALQSGLPVITSKHTPWNHLFEHKAGINLDLTVPSVVDSIEVFSTMNQQVYEDWTRATTAYVADAINLTQIQHQYSIIFGNQ